MKKLDKSEIEKLYTFTRTHYVEWYDVQTELVDHLANGIESQWKKNSSLVFDDALNIEFKKFGIFGFSELVENKEKALHKYYRNLVFKELKRHLKLPNLFLIMLSVYALKALLNVFENKDYVTITFILLILVYSSFHLYKAKKTIKNRYKTTGKKWLFDVSIMQLGGFIHLSFLLIQIPNFKDYLMLQTNIGGLVFSIVFVSYIMIIYISSCVVPKIIEENMKKRYQDLYF